MIGTVATFVCGFGLFAAGLGLQGEHPRSGVAGMVVSGVLLAVWAACLLTLLLAGGTLIQGILAAGMGLLATVLFLLAGNSARVLRLHPPPADLNVVTDEFLEARRRERRS